MPGIDWVYMKKILLVLVIVFIVEKASAIDIVLTKDFYIEINNYKQFPTDTTLDFLMTLNLVNYEDSPVDSFLSILPTNYLRRKIVGGGRPRYADALLVLYPNKVTVHIIVRQFVHMNPKSNTLQWDINLFKLEDIDHIEIHNGSNCVKGCL